jgi:hypothetical protein
MSPVRRRRRSAAPTATLEAPLQVSLAALPGHIHDRQAPDTVSSVRLWPFDQAPPQLRQSNGGDETYVILGPEGGTEGVDEFVMRLCGPRGYDSCPFTFEGHHWQLYITHSG